MAETNANTRLEAFCDGVFAIALTLLIIEIRLHDPEAIDSTEKVWHELHHLVPSFAAFLLSFGVILITWVNHHATLKLVTKSSASFIYANGFLLLTVVSIPFPTSLLGAFVTTGHGGPAVMIYNAVLAVQAIGWILVSGTALHNQLMRDESAAATLREHKRNGYMAFVLYSLLAVLGLWFPLPVAIVTAITWMFWLILSIRLKHT